MMIPRAARPLSLSALSDAPDTLSLISSDSTFGLNLFHNPVCAQHYDDSRFSILAQGRSPFHLSSLKATFFKTSSRALC